MSLKSLVWQLVWLQCGYTGVEPASIEYQSKVSPPPCLCVASDQDGAEPSANSVSASNLLRLSHYTGRQEWLHKSQQLLAAFSDRLTKVPIALPEMVRALMAQHYTLKQVIHHLPPFFFLSFFLYFTAFPLWGKRRIFNILGSSSFAAGCRPLNLTIFSEAITNSMSPAACTLTFNLWNTLSLQKFYFVFPHPPYSHICCTPDNHIQSFSQPPFGKLVLKTCAGRLTEGR